MSLGSTTNITGSEQGASQGGGMRRAAVPNQKLAAALFTLQNTMPPF